MADAKEGFDVFAFVQACGIFFKRSIDNLPSGDEVRQLMEKGTKWRWMIAGYLRGPEGDCISAFASTNELTPAEDWEEKAYRGVVATLVNGYMQRVIEMQKAQREQEQKPEIIVP